MPITQTVGAGGANLASDTLVIQLLLAFQPAPGAPMPLDGVACPATLAAIRLFQTRIGVECDGIVRPDSAMLDALRLALPRGGLASGLRGELVLRGIMPGASPAQVVLYLPHLVAAMLGREVLMPRRQPHFLAQLCHESACLQHCDAPADQDRFRPRGLLRLSGAALYLAYGRAIGRDLEGAPEAVAREPSLAVDSAAWLWQARGLNPLADADDIAAITERLGGTVESLAARAANLSRAAYFLPA